MSVAVRSDALLVTAGRVTALAEELRADAGRLAGALANAVSVRRVRGPGLGDLALVAHWLRLERQALGVVGPGGVWGEALALDTLAAGLRAAALAYGEVERAVAGVIVAVAAAADLAGTVGWLTEAPVPPVVRAVAPTLRGPLVGAGAAPGRVPGVADLVAAGEGLGGGRVRVLETTRGDGGSAWVVVVPGTQQWSPRAGANPFDVTTDVRALTGEATVAAAGVAAALEQARDRSGRGSPHDPVLLVGHSQGGMLAAALASDPDFARRHHVTHVVTSGAPVGLFPVLPQVRVLSVEHADDPVHRLDLSPNRSDASWVTVRAPAVGPPVDVSRHALGAYVGTVRIAEGAPPGTVPGLDAWEASAGAFLGAPVRSVSEAVVERAGQGAEDRGRQQT